METEASSTCPVILATDENYAAPCGVTMESLLQNTSTPSAIHFAIFGRELSTESTSRLRDVARGHGASIEIRSTDAERFQDLPVIEVGSLDTFTRLYAPTELTQFDRVLYIDCDVLVERDVAELFSVGFEDAIAAAVPHGPTPFVPEFRELHGIPHERPVFNAGVLVVDPEKWAREDIANRAVEWIEGQDEDDLFFPDQDAINVLLGDQMKALSPQWNMEARYHREGWMGLSEWWDREADGEDLILHYTGPRKPWKRWVYVPRKRAYRDYVAATPFAKSDFMTRSDTIFELERTAAWMRMVLSVARVRGGEISRYLRSVGRS